MNDKGTMDGQDREQDDADVLVLGAGMAGLAAARALATQRLRVLVLEAQRRVGGRILTQRIGDEVIELGAEFVHGRPPELLALIEEAGLELVERNGSTVRFKNGLLTSEDEPDKEISDGDQGRDDSDPFTVLEELESYGDGDISFAEFLEQKELSNEAIAAVIGFVEGFNAADHRVISVIALGVQQKAEDAIEGDRAFHVTGGYDQLPRFLAAKIEESGGEIRLKTRVQRVEWHEGRVVAVGAAQSFSARRAVIALPLGVLQQGKLEFQPELPEAVRKALQADGPIRMGHALRFTLIFRERFWKEVAPQPALSKLSFLFTPEMMPPVWWTPHPEVSNALTGWIGGPRSSTLEGLSAEDLGERVCGVLAEVFDVDPALLRGLLVGCYTHDWSSDATAMGAYSYIAKDGLEAPGHLVEPIAGTLYFAGEHTTTDGHWGTVHAALGSGLRVARQIAADAKLFVNSEAGIVR